MHAAPAPSNQAPPQIRRAVSDTPVVSRQTFTPETHPLLTESPPPIIKYHVLSWVLSTLPQAFMCVTTAPLGLTWCSATPVFLRSFPFLGPPPPALILTRGALPPPGAKLSIHSQPPVGTPHLTPECEPAAPTLPLHLPGRPLAWACPHPQGCSPQRLIQQTTWHVHNTLILPEPSLLLPRWGGVRERPSGLSSAHP